jgi:cyclophilin family peptidyl-prolyl cis-trans isomerase/HEAT repeat protein
VRRNRLVPVIGLATVAACARVPVAPATPEPTPAVVVAPSPPIPRPPLELTEAEIRSIAELMLEEDRRILDTDRVTELLEHWSPEVRSHAALAVGRIGDRRGVPLLLGALDDTVPSVVAEAAFALGELADSSDAVSTALRRLIQTHPDDSVGVEGVSALAKIGTPEAFTASLDVLAGRLGSGSIEQPGLIRREALLTLWRYPRVADALSLVTPYLDSPDGDVRWRAAYALVRPGLVPALGRLLDLASDPEAEVRALAARALRAGAADSAGVTARARAVLGAALQDPSPHVRINAINAAATFRDATLVGPIASLVRDGDANVRMAAVQALGAMRQAEASTALERAIADTTERIGIRAAALSSLAACDEVAARPAISGWAEAERWLQRMYAARVLSTLPWTEVGEIVLRLARDTDPRVARAAFAAVARGADSTAEAHALYIEGLRSPEPMIRAAAIAGLARRRSAGDFAALMDAYGQAQNEADNSAALAAIDALAELRRSGVAVENAFFARFRAPVDPAILRRVERRFGRSWADAPVPEPRGAAFYEDAVRSYIVPEMAGREPPHLVIATEIGDIEIRLAAADAPLTVRNIITLAESGYFSAGADPDSRRWHRVVPNFVLQDGDPRGDGSGGPGYSIRDEINRRRYGRGVLGMALSGPDTGGSQFFITHSPQPHLDGGYTIFGTVVSGMDVADAVVQDDRILGIRVVH